jgi:hypothetical protein
MKIFNTLTFAALAATLLFQTSITRAGDHGQRGGDNERGDRDHRDATITWTKWITKNISPPGDNGIFATVEGRAGGDIGDGTLTGEAFNAVVTQVGNTTTTVFDAVYHFVGSKHSLTVHFDAVQTKVVNGTVITVSGVVRGVVTDGWLKGNIVEGEYTRYACTQVGSVNGFCFDGIFEIKRGSKHED